MAVVVSLWLVTTYLVLHVSSILRSVFSILAVWKRLVAVLGAWDDERVPNAAAAVHVTSLACSIVWTLARPVVCFKYNPRLRRALRSSPQPRH